MLPIPSDEILDVITAQFKTYFTYMLERKDVKVMWVLPCQNKEGNSLAILVQLLPLPDDKFIREVMGMVEEKTQ
jgi:hypothetical protein